MKTTWEDVQYSKVEREKGILKCTVEDHKLTYSFFPDSCLKKKGDLSGAKPVDSFLQKAITWAERDVTVVKFKLGSDDEYSFTFKTENHAKTFIGQLWHLKKKH